MLGAMDSGDDAGSWAGSAPYARTLQEQRSEDRTKESNSRRDALTRACVRSALFSSSPAPRIGKYTLVEHIGEGGLGTVYRATDPDLGRQVAIKILHHASDAHSKGQARLAREARALASLAHPNVVVVHETGVHDGQLFLVMEYVSGETLRGWWEARDRTWEEIVDVLRQAAEGLAAAHEAGLVHRDFKPDNVVIDGQGRARVLDFGLARPEAEVSGRPDTPLTRGELTAATMSHAGTVVGTPAYMSPEQFRGAIVDARSDQFSFFVSLFEALHGVRPFDGSSFEELRAAVTSGKTQSIDPARELPAELSSALSRGLLPEPKDRFRDMRVVVELLRGVLSPSHRSRPRWPAAAAIATGIAFAGIGLTAWFSLPKSSTSRRATSTQGAVPARNPKVELTMERLTRTPGSGLTAAALDPTGKTLAYSVEGDVWLRQTDGGVPRRASSPPEVAGQLAFGSTADTLWVTNARGLFRVDVPGGEAVFVAPDTGPGQYLSFSQAANVVAVASETTLVRIPLDAPGEAVRSSLAGHPSGMAWSPDGRHLALRQWKIGEDVEVVEVFEALSGVVARATVPASPTEGLIWEQPNAITYAAGSKDTLGFGCLDIGGDRSDIKVRPGTTEGPALEDAQIRVTGDVAGGSVIALAAKAQRDVVVGTLWEGKIRDLQRLAPEVSPENRSPRWSSSDEFAYLSGVHMRPSVFLRDPAGALTAVPGLSGAAIALAATASGELLVSSLDDDDHSQLLLLQGLQGGPVRKLTDPSTDPVVSMKCDSKQPRCVMLRRQESGLRFDTVDVTTLTVERGAVCPREARCVADRFSVTHGGVLVVDATGSGVLRLNPSDGSVRPTSFRLREPAEIQSLGGLLEDGSLVATRMKNARHEEGDTYRIVRLLPGGGASDLWSSPERWVVDPNVSPDGNRIALTSLDFRSEAYVVHSINGVCTGADVSGP